MDIEPWLSWRGVLALAIGLVLVSLLLPLGLWGALLIVPLLLVALAAWALRWVVARFTYLEDLSPDEVRRLSMWIGGLGALGALGGCVLVGLLFPDSAGLGGVPYLFSAALIGPLLLALLALGLFNLYLAVQRGSWSRRAVKCQGLVCFAIPVVGILYWPHVLAFLLLGAFSFLPLAAPDRPGAGRSGGGRHPTEV